MLLASEACSKPFLVMSVLFVPREQNYQAQSLAYSLAAAAD